jgi:N-acetylmuramoyl-L-alanine amidase
MKLLYLGLVPWMGLIATAAPAQVRSAEVLYTHFTSVAQRAYRLGDACFVPIDEVSTWGWTATVHGEEADIEAEGQKVTAPVRTFDGRPSILLGAAVDKLHGGYDWVPESDTFEVYSPLSSISSHKGSMEAKGPLSVHATPYFITNPNRVMIDIEGARLDPKTQEDYDAYSRAFQFRRNVVRLVIDTTFVPVLPSKIDPSNDVTLDVSPPAGENPVDPPVTVPPPVNPPPVAPTNTEIGMSIDSDTETETEFRINLNQAIVPEYRKPDPSTLQIVLKGSNQALPQDFKLATDAVTGTELSTDNGSPMLVFHLKRPMGATVWSDGAMLKVQLLKPEVGDGHLAHKVVVVDPGHGGHDNGAHCFGVNEKDLTLKIGLLLAKDLAAQGATVIMTRTTDVFIPLTTRAAIANSNHADLFISCHINSTGGDGMQSGGITFHHFGKGISRVLAECIQAQIAKVNKLPNLGVWSDGKIYRTGFSVLRNTQMPSVLMELGFINNPHDVKRLTESEFQTSVASAVVKGVKDYLGDGNTK